ncbi:MAG TPA: 2-hydroxyacyl-CoA dehydratase family protein [Sphingomonadaceae bacterium]|nr:2-hydroxyacyl-CoA dehydratase family protein [Sphingomonadaceae bacterium]
MNETQASAQAKPARQDISQLAVTKSLRAYQRSWFNGLKERVAAGAPFAIGAATTPHEIFEALDIEFVADVWYSAVVSARRQSSFYSDILTRRGFHEGLSRYSALTLATVIADDDADRPWGGLPKAGLVTGNVHDRSGQVLAEHWGVPYVGFEVPAFRTLYPNWWDMSHYAWEELDGSERIDFMVGQIEKLIAASEELTGRKLDRDRLREILDRVNAQEELFEDVRGLIRTASKLPARLDEVMGQVMGIQWHRGTQWALDQATAFRDEVRDRVDRADWVCPDERVRLMYVGAGLWQQLDFFASFERSYGATFVRSNYLSFAIDGYQRYGTSDPVRALASRYVSFNRQMHTPPMAGAWAAWEAKTHNIQGAVQIEAGRGMKFITRTLEEAGIPVLQFPVDPVNAKTWDEERLRGIMTDFLENRLGAKRLAA